MTRVVLTILLIVFAASGAIQTFMIFTYDGPIYLGLLFVDYPNPNGHGLKGVTISTPEILLKIINAAGQIALAIILARRLKTTRAASIHPNS